MMRLFAAGLMLALAAAPTFAAQQQAPSGQQPAPSPGTPQQQEPDPDQVTFEEQVVVSASRTEQQLVNAPATVSLISNETIQNSPGTNIGDLIRAVPGVNVSQISARDVNITSRGATSTLSTSQLALVDGRSVYLDFFGMVMWDLIPTNASDVRQIEVIRGPASAVWGANAMNGVVNVITKTPREIAAEGQTSLTIGAGWFGRGTEACDVSPRPTGCGDDDAGALFSVNGRYAQAVSDRWSYKLSAGYLSQDPLPRPVGNIPNAFQTPYPPYVNEGTSQPKFDARVDYDLVQGGTITVSGGLAGTEGIIHSGIGPFDIASDSKMTYLTTRYVRGGRRIAFFTNLLDGNAANLLARSPDGQPLPLDFNTKTFDIDATDIRTIGTRHVLSFGGNFRRNTFDISLAPNGDDRNEGGVFLQDEIFFNDMFRWVVGGRIDKFSSIDDAVFSPRTTLLIKPAADQTFRVSFNRAFRAPSFINNHIETTILNEANLSGIVPLLGPLPPPVAAALTQQLSRFVFPIVAVGNPDLDQETMTAFEIGYSGSIRNRATLSAAVYWNHTDDGIYFTQIDRFSAVNPPPGWPAPIPTAVLNLLPPPGLPNLFSYRNLGSIDDKGIELGVDAAVTRAVNVFTNYSYQWEPEVDGFPITEINLPPAHRFNAGFNFSSGRFLGNLAVSYTDEAFWQDVLDARFAGRTDAYTLVNGGIGVRWADERVLTSLKVNNLAGKEVMQHIFGDVMKRQVIAEVRLTF
jgi:iron complex outermembrane receptor protein